MKEKFSGYRVAAGTIIYLFFAWCMINVTSVAFGVFLEHFGGDMTQVSLGVTIYALACSVISMFAGEYQKRAGPRNVMILGALDMEAFCFVIAFVPSIWSFYLAQLTMASASSTSMHACCTMVISNWFVKGRARLISIAMAGALFGAAAFQFAAGQVFVAVGVSRLYLYFGILQLVVLLFCALFLIQDSTEKLGQKPLGWEEQDAAPQKADAAPREERPVSVCRTGPTVRKGDTLSLRYVFSR